MVSLFKSIKFLPLFLTQFFGAFNDNAFKNALLIWFVYEAAQGQNLGQNLGQNSPNPEQMVNLAAGLFILPFFLFSAIAGQMADKMEKSWLIRRIKMAEIFLMICCFAGFYWQNAYFLLFILFLMGMQSTLFGPLKYSLLPLHLPKNQLIAGNGAIEAGTFLAILLGTIAGGLLIRLDGGIYIISFLVICCAIFGYFSSRHIPLAPAQEPKLTISLNIFAQTLKIIRKAQEEKTVFLSIMGISWFWFIGLVFLTQFPLYTKNIIGGDEKIVTFFLATFSIGIGIGSFWCNKLLKGQINGRLVPCGILMMSLAILAFCLASILYQQNINANNIGLGAFLLGNFYGSGISLCLFALAVAAGIYIVPLYAIMQERAPKEHLARIIAANNIINALFMVGASAFAMVLFAAGFNVNGLFLAVSILSLISFFFVKKIVQKHA
jgi:acyl-[acyl-carrier-protein]-phospholipid O-acyltransferase / long-chain-fatty-acid--[acyl-carrier-protein] ligase